MPRVRAPGASDATLVAAVIAGKRIADVAVEHRVAYSTVCKAVLAHEKRIGHRLNRPTQAGDALVKAPVDVVIAHRRAGLTMTQIGELVGCSRQYVGRVIAIHLPVSASRAGRASRQVRVTTPTAGGSGLPTGATGTFNSANGARTRGASA